MWISRRDSTGLLLAFISPCCDLTFIPQFILLIKMNFFSTPFTHLTFNVSSVRAALLNPHCWTVSAMFLQVVLMCWSHGVCRAWAAVEVDRAAWLGVPACCREEDSKLCRSRCQAEAVEAPRSSQTTPLSAGRIQAALRSLGRTRGAREGSGELWSPCWLHVSHRWPLTLWYYEKHDGKLWSLGKHGCCTVWLKI